MNEIEIKDFCVGYIQSKRVEKVKGVTVSGLYNDESTDRLFFAGITTERFLKEYVEEDFCYYHDGDYETPFWDLEYLNDSLCDDIFEYLEEKGLSDEIHDKIADYYQLKGYDLLIDYIKKLEEEEHGN